MSTPEGTNRSGATAVELPAGSPANAIARQACEVPLGTWLAPLEKAANPTAWRPALGRTTGAEHVTFFYTLASPGRASKYSKFPRGVWLAWCNTPPKFPASASATVEAKP